MIHVDTHRQTKPSLLLKHLGASLIEVLVSTLIVTLMVIVLSQLSISVIRQSYQQYLITREQAHFYRLWVPLINHLQCCDSMCLSRGQSSILANHDSTVSPTITEGRLYLPENSLGFNHEGIDYVCQ